LQVEIEHVPVEQVAVEFESAQVEPQVPQLLSVRVDVSQPLLSTPSQFPKPALHVAMAQLPVLQVAVALVRPQVPPQTPQFVRVFRRVSQPLPSRPSQLPQPASHERIWQLPLPQVAVAFAREQVVPHAPQLVSVVVDVSQPLLSMPSQLAKPVLQLAIPQTPVSQVAAAFAREQLVPHAPQLLSVRVEVSQPFVAFASQFA
jgi:hypothetical protein